MDSLLAIDQGMTSPRCILFDRRGRAGWRKAVGRVRS